MRPHRILVVLSLLLAAPGLRAEILERVIVKVNGAIVTQSEFENRQVASIQQARVGPERVESFLRDNNARILQEAIDELILVQRADEIGIKPRREYTDDVIEQIRKENNIPDEEALKDQLKREGMTLSDLRRNIERSLLRQEVLRREVQPKIGLTEADVRAEYEKRKDEFTRPAQVHLLEIVVPADAEDPPAAAREIVAALRGGADFATLARERSKAPSAAAGGELGKLDVKALAPSIRRATEGLKPGEVSAPIAMADGAQRIFKLVERSDEGVASFDDVKTDLRKTIADSRFSTVYDEYIKDLRQKAIVDVRVREVPLQVAVPATSILDPPSADETGIGAAAPAEATAAPSSAPAADEEFVTTPQAAPERVTPGAEPAPEEKPQENPPR
jgi:parvulin-like peptidyl-prolyl isomerase